MNTDDHPGRQTSLHVMIVLHVKELGSVLLSKRYIHLLFSFMVGWNTSGFNVSTGNQLTLNFVIPNPGDSIGIHETALWIFPDPSQLRNHSISELTLLVVVELAHANKPRREVMRYSWRMDSSCLRLNLTGLSRKVVNNLQKRGLEKTNITVSVEVVAANDPEVTHETFALDTDLQEGCSALHNRKNNAPFLVMKYYDENSLTSVEVPFSENEVVTPSPSRQQKRQSESDQSGAGPSSPTVPTTSDSWKGCQVVPLRVNLTKVFGGFINLPTEMYINDCSGSCNTGRNTDSFTLHARIKEQIKLVEGVNTLQRSDTCCAPSSYEERYLLIRKENYFSIVSFPMVVTGCHCL